jgi:two-component system, cell cycle sensor histidine kinase and response regulator CckA
MRKETSRRTLNPKRIANLAQRLAETSKELESLMAGEADTILGPDGESFLLLSAQESLRQAVNMQRMILDAIPAHLAMLDLDGKVVFVNESWRRLIGLPTEGSSSLAVGQNYIEYCELADQAFGGAGFKIAEGIRNVLKDGAYPYTLTHPVHKEGTIKWYRVTATSLDCTDLIGAVIMYQDVTEQHLAEEQIHQQAMLLDQAEDAIFVEDMQGRIEYWNSCATRLHGWEAIEVLGRCTQDFLYADVAPVKEAWAILLRCGVWRGELKKLAKDGRELTFQTRWTLVRDASDNPKSVLSISTDVTERKKIEEQVLRVQRLESIGTLAGGIAHDLNNMLVPILMSADLLMNRLKDTKNRELAETVETSAKRGVEMVRRVLAFARGSESNWTRISPLAVAKEIAQTIATTFLKKVHLITNVSANVWSVFGDPMEIHQVLLNLAVNARDAMPEGGTLAISVTNVRLEEHEVSNTGRVAGAYVRFAVSDTGSGIAPDIREKIFDPFFTTKEVGKGTGLGLSTALGIVKSYRGFMNLTSEVGHGSTFEFYLPADFSASSNLGKPPQQELPRGNNELVLVIDDEASIRQVIRQTLETFGYRVVTAEGGSEALSIYVQRQVEIAAVITDMMMPMMNGVATTEALVRVNSKVKIIVVTGFVTDAQKEDAMAAGASEFLSKPFTIEKLLATLSSVLRSGFSHETLAESSALS